MRLFAFVVVLNFVVLNISFAQSDESNTENWEAEHQRGVELARDGQYEESLRILNSLLERFPDNYPIQRDYIIIATWKGDCRNALTRYKKIQAHLQQEPYLILPVSECLVKQKKFQQASALLQKGLDWWPDNEELKSAQSAVQTALERDAQGILTVSLSTHKSQFGSREWLLSTKYSDKVYDRTRLYAHFLGKRADDPGFKTGEMNRLGMGVEYTITNQLLLDQEFSFDVSRSGEFGSTTALNYTPHELWAMNLSYATFADDISLRATGVDTKAKRLTAGADYHTADYRWEWGASTAYYDYNDGNKRKSLFTYGGYGFEMKPQREQHLILGIYGSQGETIDVPYYNPKSDLSATLTYRLDLVYDSRFQRHVDHIYVVAGSYKQENYGTDATGALRFEQDYDLNRDRSLSWGVAYTSNVYDGNRESGVDAYLTFVQRF
jgi:tetratricopeptide (TPR) repeat protein